MARSIATIVLGLNVILCAVTSSGGAELQSRPLSPQAFGAPGYQSCRYLPSCGAAGCVPHQLCRPTYSDAYLGHSLYGAYGPYGGTLYWGGYTAAGWGVQ